MATTLTNTTFNTTYKDDFLDSDNYHRILFNSGRLLQARELTQLQTIIQKQIERFGNNVFTEGGMVKAGGVNVNNAFEFIKLDTDANALPADPTTLIGKTFGSQDANDVRINIIDVVPATGSDPATLYVNYKFTQNATAGVTPIRMSVGVDISDGETTLTVQNDAGAVGVGTAFNVQSGIFYAKGHFIFVDNQTKIISKYTDTFTGTMGFKVIEDVVTVTDDNDLYDNQGAIANLAAPGADRYRIRLELVNEVDIPTDSFIFLAELQDGRIVKKVTEFNSYDIPSELIARRIKENSGDYLINPFTASFEKDSANTHLLLKVSDGVAVVDGFRVSRNASTLRIQKSTSTVSETKEFISANYGNYVKVRPIILGNTKGLPNIATREKLNIRDSSAYHSSGSTIGTARVMTIMEDGLDRRYHLFDIQMNAGQSFRNAKSIGTSTTNYFNILQENNQAVLHDADKNNLLFPLPTSRPDEIKTTGIDVTLQKFKADVGILTTGQVSGSLETSGVGTDRTYVDEGEWIFAKNDSDVYMGSNITLAGDSGGITFNPITDVAAGTYEAAFFVKDASAAIREKTLATVDSSIPVDSDGNGIVFLPLRKADIYDIDSIKDSAGDIHRDYTSRFTLDDGQRDTFYDNGRLILNKNQSIPTTASGKIYVKFRHFTHGGGEFFAVNSYNALVTASGYDAIPKYTFSNGTTTRLSEFIDFRSVKDNDGEFTGTGAAVNFMPKPNGVITADIDYYVAQTGKLVLTKDGIIQFIIGDTGTTVQKFPKTPIGNLSLYNIVLGANTLNDSDVSMQFIENKRFTMKDISTLENRVERLEEATTLTLLEIDTKNLQVLDSSGLNRTRSGFIADNFDDQFFSNTKNPDYRAAIDPSASFLFPTFSEDNIRLIFDSANSTDVVRKGDNIYLSFDSAEFIDAAAASTSVKINPFDVVRFEGNLKLSPSSDEWRDVNTITAKVVDGGVRLDTTQAYLYDNWSWNWGGKDIEDLKVGSKTKNTKNGLYNKIVASEKVTKVIDERIIESVLLPFMRQQKVFFKATGLKPNTQHFAFFDETTISNFAREETFRFKSDTTADDGNTKKNITAHPEGSSNLISDSDGSIEGSFFLPATTFRTGSKPFTLLDVTAHNPDFSTSLVSTNFSANGVLDTVEQDIETTRCITIKGKKVVVAPPPKINNNNDNDGPKGHVGVAYDIVGGKFVKTKNTDGSVIGSGTKADQIGGAGVSKEVGLL